MNNNSNTKLDILPKLMTSHHKLLEPAYLKNTQMKISQNESKLLPLIQRSSMMQPNSSSKQLIVQRLISNLEFSSRHFGAACDRGFQGLSKYHYSQKFGHSAVRLEPLNRNIIAELTDTEDTEEIPKDERTYYKRIYKFKNMPILALIKSFEIEWIREFEDEVNKKSSKSLQLSFQTALAIFNTFPDSLEFFQKNLQLLERNSVALKQKGLAQLKYKVKNFDQEEFQRIIVIKNQSGQGYFRIYYPTIQLYQQEYSHNQTIDLSPIRLFEIVKNNFLDMASLVELFDLEKFQLYLQDSENKGIIEQINESSNKQNENINNNETQQKQNINQNEDKKIDSESQKQIQNEQQIIEQQSEQKQEQKSEQNQEQQSEQQQVQQEQEQQQQEQIQVKQQEEQQQQQEEEEKEKDEKEKEKDEKEQQQDPQKVLEKQQELDLQLQSQQQQQLLQKQVQPKQQEQIIVSNPVNNELTIVIIEEKQEFPDKILFKRWVKKVVPKDNKYYTVDFLPCQILVRELRSQKIIKMYSPTLKELDFIFFKSNTKSLLQILNEYVQINFDIPPEAFDYKEFKKGTKISFVNEEITEQPLEITEEQLNNGLLSQQIKEIEVNNKDLQIILEPCMLEIYNQLTCSTIKRPCTSKELTQILGKRYLIGFRLI